MRRQRVEQASREWRAALLDVSAANRLLYFQPTRSTLALDDADPDVVARLLAGRTVKLPQLFPDQERRTAAERTCAALAARQREAVEEYGVSVAHLALGMATWTAGREDGGSARRRPPAAPVLLRELGIRIQRGLRATTELRLTGDAQLNPVLAHLLAAQGVRLDEEDVLGAGGDDGGLVEPILEHVRAACAGVEGFGVRHELVAGAFSYTKQPMVADCEDVDALAASDLVAALAGDEGAAAAVRAGRSGAHHPGAGGSGAVARDPDHMPVAAEHLVLDADASQSDVVAAALDGRTLVVQGPPGTGKSQTIANLVACLVAEGRRVLFVAQKRAAVTAVLDRLDGVGLGDLTLDLFAATASRRYVADRMAAVLAAQATVGEPVTDDLHRALAASRDRLVGYHDALHEHRRGWGVSLADALGQVYALPAEAATPVRLPASALERWGDSGLDRLAEALAEFARRGGLRPDLRTRRGWSPAYLTSADRVEEASTVARELRVALLPALLDRLPALQAETGLRPPVDLAALDELLAELAEAADVAALAPGAVAPDLDDGDLRRMLAATGREYRRASGVRVGWLERFGLRRAARELLADGVRRHHSRRPELHDLLLRADAARRRWREREVLGGVRRLDALPPATSAREALGAALEQLAPALQEVGLRRVPLADLPAALDTLLQDRERGQFPRLHALEGELAAAGCDQLLAALRREVAVHGGSGEADGGALAAARLRYAALHSVVEQALTSDPALAGMRGEDLDEAVERFDRADREHLRANAARVRRAAAERLARTLDAHPVQHLVLTREVTRKRNISPVRRLFEQAPDVLTALKPVWAMSPLQVSRLLPAAPCFDVVVMDEASQIAPADAIPALLRAPQAVVAGDARQLPPTSFFAKVVDLPEEPDPGEDAVLPATTLPAGTLPVEATMPAGPPAPRLPGGTFTADAESILFAFDRVLAGQSRRLLWHYRSRDERLIATSNAAVYDGSLTTFPAADGAGCLRHEVVPPSAGVGGGTNSPAAEVARVRDLVLDHARTRPGESLGVIAFGIPHARRIEAALDEAFDADPDLEAALTADPREPFFVKNIERVQGDERDAIILSVGYGRAADGRLPLFWGPLLQDGGARRLNVAISRARRRMTLVTSFAAQDLPAGASSAEGYRLLQRFVRHAASGGADGEHADGEQGALLPGAFEADVARRLAAAGLDVVPRLGSGAYRLDLAVRHPHDRDRFVLAVETDGPGYATGRIARERDRLRPAMLEQRGWRFHRIWSVDWWTDPDGEVAAAVAAYRSALAGGHAGSPLPVPAPGVAVPEAGTADWHVAPALRTVPPPPFTPGLGVDRYDDPTLVALVRHVRSDQVLRTREQEFDVLMAELGFRKRGRRIVAALTRAQDRA